MKTLTLRNKIGYAAGDMANMASFGMSASFLLVYYVDVLGITAAAAGTLFLIARLWDGINDPMMGAFADKLFAKHKGIKDKFKPFIFKGCWVLLIASVLMFWSPEGLSDGQTLAWAYLTYIVWGMSYTFVNIPFGSVASVMTQDPEERASLSAFRSLGGVIGMVLCKIIVPAVLALYADDIQTGYLMAMVGLASIGIFGHLFCYISIKENIKCTNSATQVSSWQAMKAIPKNKPLLCVSLASFFILLAMFVTSSVLMFYIKNNLSNALWVMSVTGIIDLIMIVMMAPLLPKMVAKLGTKKLMMNSAIVAVISCTVAFFLVSNVYLFLLFYSIMIFGIMIPMAACWGQVSDCIDYNQYLTGSRQEGIIYASYSLMRKIGGAGAGFIAALGVGFIGYNPDLTMQTESTLQGLQFLVFGFPVIAFIIVFFLYKTLWVLDAETYDKMVEANKNNS
ncbi:MAG: glycoside-pentoside-hexuronide (GPH):cation symporter [Shewanella sp.]